MLIEPAPNGAKVSAPLAVADPHAVAAPLRAAAAAPPPVAPPLRGCVAIVGRPNVGKSTLFNRLTGRRQALVIDAPGATRDRIDGIMEVAGHPVRLVDTGGIDVDADDPLVAGVREQAELAIADADAVLLVVDGRIGLTPADEAVVQRLRRSGRPLAVLVNKADVPARDAVVHDFYALGIDPVVPISAEHGRGMDALHDFLTSALAHARPRPADAGAGASRTDDAWESRPIRVALVGVPNAGKSSLVNSFLGAPRHLACATAGTTRDPVDSAWRHGGRDFVFVDTAGIRRKSRIDGRLEQLSVSAAMASIDRCDVAVLVLDASVRPSEQDGRIAAMAHDKGKALVLALNKWDLISNPEWRERYIEALRLVLPFADYAPLARVSAHTGRGRTALIDLVVEAQRQRHRRVSTGELNRLVHKAVTAHPPPMSGGRRPAFYFVSQPLVRPPTFVFHAKGVTKLHFSYVRYLSNAIRGAYGFAGTPIWLKFRDRNQA